MKNPSPRLALVALLLLLPLAALPRPALAGGALLAETYRELDRIRDEKKQALFAYLGKLKSLAEEIKTDPAMRSFFHVKNGYWRLRERVPPPPGFLKELEELKERIRRRFLERYLAFFDLLFVNRDGDVIFTVRGQGDAHKNLFRGELAETRLARQLSQAPLETFVDFEYYKFSGEPSAFHAVPVLHEGTHEGWFVLQCAVNRINEILSDDGGPGATGETFLVNRNEFMLTDSRYLPDPSILRRHLSPENIRAKFAEGSGHRIVTDYRGYRALTSFEVCRVGGAEWLLVAKVDEDEILTKAYLGRRDELRAPLVAALVAQPPVEAPPAEWGGPFVDVDMDEYRKAVARERIRTHGVSTCTAIVLSLPGRFAYLAHASNRDAIYGGSGTDLIGRVMRRIENFDIYRWEKRKLKAAIVAPHGKSLARAVDLLLERGILLSQITFLHDGAALHGSPVHDCVRDKTRVEWRTGTEPAALRHQSSEDVKPLGECVKGLLDYP